MAKWLIRNKKGNIKLMSQTLNISEELAQILINRNICTKNTAIRYLSPKVSYFHNNFEMKDMANAINLLKSSINKGEKIAVYGDYDVDGIMSTTILYKGLKGLGANVIYYIPDREKEGYGLNIEAVTKLKEANVDIIIACDNGIAAIQEIDYANTLGIKSIIIDHHESILSKNLQGEVIEVLPKANSIINPKQKFCNYKFKLMCAASLCYKFIYTYYQQENIELINNDELLIFAAIATFCDIVDLQDENRIIVTEGLKLINLEIKNIGLKCLFAEKNYENTYIDEFAIGFVIGPCINATGRLKHASLAVELLLTEDYEKAVKLSKEISALNEKRKLLTENAINELNHYINSSDIKNDNVIVVYNKDIHESIAGIVAGRIKDKLYRPTIVLTKGEHMVKGSARSIEKYNIFNELSKCKHLFERFGGHDMAAGLSMLEENICQLRTELNNNFNLTEDALQEIIYIEKEMFLENITYTLAQELNILRPFGKSNKEPIFGTKGVEVQEIRIIEDKNTIIFTFNIVGTYRKIKGICFGKVEKFKDLIINNFDTYDQEKIFKGILRSVNLNLDIVYSIDINEYNGNTSVQLKIKDFRIIN